LSYVKANTVNQWASLPEYGAGSWTQLLERLRMEYLELTSKEQSTMGQLRKLCQENTEILMLEENRLMEFKRQ